MIIELYLRLTFLVLINFIMKFKILNKIKKKKYFSRISREFPNISLKGFDFPEISQDDFFLLGNFLGGLFPILKFPWRTFYFPNIPGYDLCFVCH